MTDTQKQNAWYLGFSIFFIGVLLGSLYFLDAAAYLPVYISPFDFFLLSVATFRVIRLFTYDKITQFVRDWFHNLTEAVVDGEVVIIRTKPAPGFRRTAAELLDCPWCFGMWAALVLVFLYFATPLAWYLVLFLAVSGAGSFLQLTANFVGWRAEREKIEALRG